MDTILFGAALFVLIVGFSLYYVMLAGTHGLIIIHFLGGYGADFLGEKYDALGMLFAGLVILTVNALLAGILYDRNRVMTRCISIVTLLITLLIVIAISCIITVN